MDSFSQTIPIPGFGLGGFPPIAHFKFGTDFADLLTADDGNDWLLSGGLGEDILMGRGGNDTLNGGDDNDELYGNGGDDILRGEQGDDTLVGGTGNDTYYVDSNDIVIESPGINSGIDTVRLGDWNDLSYDLPTLVENLRIEDDYTGWYVYGNGLNNELIGNDNDNYLYGEDGEDTIKGRNGEDSIYGGSGNDDLFGGRGNDSLYGGIALNGPDSGDDTLTGGYGNDSLFGENGADTLLGFGRLGDIDLLDGGAADNAADTFILGSAVDGLFYTGSGYAEIYNFEEGIDTIVLTGSFDDYTLQGGVVTGIGDELSLTPGELTIFASSDLNNPIAYVVDNGGYMLSESDFTFV